VRLTAPPPGRQPYTRKRRAGTYEAKQNGFAPGASSLHLAMTPHGPDAATFAAASRPEAAAAPSYLGRGAYAFMFETSATPRVTAAAMGAPNIDRDYYRCWAGLADNFTGPPAGSA
jgi:homogentisate 1,2-dioxygenase